MKSAWRWFGIPLAGIMAAWLMLGPPALAGDIVVIASKAAPAPVLDVALLRDIYLKKIFLDDNGRKFIPVNLPVDHPLRNAVSMALFSLGSDELQDYWNQRYFHGVMPPYVLGSQDAVVRFVAKTPGAIGYIMPCYLDAGVQVVLRLSAGPASGLEGQGLCPPSARETHRQP